MRRREFFTAIIGSAIAWHRQAQAQQRLAPLVGILRPLGVLDPATDPSISNFRLGLRELGYVEGQNISLAVRSAGGDNTRLPSLASELAALKPDVIVANGEAAIRAAMGASSDIPIVMAVIDDPVAMGFVRSLTHPGSNLTGLSNLASGLVAKRLQTLLETVPSPRCVAVIRDPGSGDALKWQEVAAAAKTLGAVLAPIAIGSAGELEAGFAEIVRNGCRALLVMSSPVYFGLRARLTQLAGQYPLASDL